MLERLIQLEINIKELEKFKSVYSIKQIQNDLQIEWILRYGLFESIQIVIDVSCHVVVKFNLGAPSSYYECLEILGKENYLKSELIDKITGMTGLRNILIHEYTAVEVEKLFNLLDSLDDFREFAQQIKEYL